MRLVGSVDTFNRGFVRAIVATSKFGGICEPIDFLVDTGAGKTILSAFDAKNIGIDITKLDKSEIPVSGLGGDVKAGNLGECQLIFQQHAAFLMETLDNILVLEQDKKHNVTDSVLGMDILRNCSIKFIGQNIVLER